MNPRHAFFACLERSPPALFEAALWIAAEHDPTVQPLLILQELNVLQQQVSLGMPLLPADELGQPLLRRLNDLGFAQDDFTPLRPAAALLDKVLQRKRGQPLAMGLIAMELAQRLNIPMVGVNFPGHFLLRVPGADHLLDPCGGRRLYPNDCRELLQRQYGPDLKLQADHLRTASPRSILQRLSRNLRQCTSPMTTRWPPWSTPSACWNWAMPAPPITWRGPACINAWTAQAPSVSTWSTRCCSAKTRSSACA